MKFGYFALTLLLLSGCSGNGTTLTDTQNSTLNTDVGVVKVFKSDGAVQCESAGTPVDEMASELVNVGIDVICGQKGDSGSAVATMCGGETTSINIYTIHDVSLLDAEAHGFKNVTVLPDYKDQACES